jgi:hypothetical protein
METKLKTITDRKDRFVKIGLEGLNLIAECDNRMVAEWAFVEYDDRMLLGVVKMQTDSERCGIGSEMWKEAEDCYQAFAIAKNFSIAGAAFLNSRVSGGECKFEHEQVYDSRFC